MKATEDQIMAWFMFHHLVKSGERLQPSVLQAAVAEYRQIGMMAADSMLRRSYSQYAEKFPVSREPTATR